MNELNLDQDQGDEQYINIGNQSSQNETESSFVSKGKPKKIGEALIAKGLISSDQLEIALKEFKENNPEGKILGKILTDLGFITESALAEAIEETSGIKKFDLASAVLDPNLLTKLPKEVAARHKCLPVNIENELLIVATNDIYNLVALDQVKKYYPKHLRVTPVFAQEAEILDAIDQYYQYEMSINGILKEIETGIRSEKKQLSGEGEGYINPTVRLVDAILIDAIKMGASDIHFEPEGTFLRLRYRLDGIMMQIRSFHKEYWSAIAVRIKIISGMNIAETRSPQDGRIAYNVMGREVDFRVATQPTIHGENIVMRILDKKQSLVPLPQLGISEENVKLLIKMLKRPEGIVIVTGPTGSGKTTTLYSILNYINSVDKNIMTLEDPVEYQLPLIRQSNIREGVGMNFIDGIKSLMRQDPDIIFVGEVRDESTANMALRAAMTGHQVFTTLHTNDALGAIPRLMDIGVKPSLLSGSLICIIAQRLARKLCEYCKKADIANEEECKILGTESGTTIFRKQGCEKCSGRGYKGRIAVCEILPFDRGLDELVATLATRKVMLEYLKEHGFKQMADDGIDKVLKGVTTIDELIDNIDMTVRL
ncbi:MAG: GspE/PulE family protein [Alphaproteobacteria bacterium]